MKEFKSKQASENLDHNSNGFSIEGNSHQFCDKLLSTVEQALQEESILFSPLDQCTVVLAISPFFKYSAIEAKNVAREVKDLVLKQKYPSRQFVSFSWNEIAQKAFIKNPLSIFSRFKIDIPLGTQIYFFVDVKAIGDSLSNQATLAGYTALNASSAADRFTSLQVSFNQMTIEIDLCNVIADAVWTGDGTQKALHNLIRALPERFEKRRWLQGLIKAELPELVLTMTANALELSIGGKAHSIGWHELEAAIAASGLSPEQWLDRIEGSDLAKLGQKICISARARDFTNLRPNHLVYEDKRHVLSVDIFPRTIPLLVAETPQKNMTRFCHYYDEAKRGLGEAAFELNAIILEHDNTSGVAFVGEQAASLIVFPHLIKEALTQVQLSLKRVHAFSDCEDVLLVVSPNLSANDAHCLLERAHDLLRESWTDGFDPLYVNRTLSLPDFGLGNVRVGMIPTYYFELVGLAESINKMLFPGRSEYLLGLSKELIHDYENATIFYKKSLIYDASDGHVFHALGRVLLERDLASEAIPYLQNAKKRLPNEAEVANTLGMAYLKISRFMDAIGTFERAVELAPSDASFLANLGRTYFSVSRIADAEKVLKQALKLVPTFPDAHATLAQIHWRLGDLQAAKEHAQKAFAADPANERIQDLLWALRVEDSAN
jgi:tetratricopeptide (TPR) repeat protein